VVGIREGPRVIFSKKLKHIIIHIFPDAIG
jgi:hypothetical protein